MNRARKDTYNRNIVFLKKYWKKRKALIKKAKFVKVDIYKYYNLIDYLQAWYKKNKNIHNELFSYEIIAKKLGYISKGGLYKIFQGGKFPSSQTINKFIKVMGLSTEEANYLILLSHFSKIKRKDILKEKLIKGYKKLL